MRLRPIATAAGSAALLAACFTEQVPDNAPSSVTENCVPYRMLSDFVQVGSGGRGYWVTVRTSGGGVDIYGWVQYPTDKCGPTSENLVWDAGI